MIESKSRRKKSRGGTGFFQFAETVEEDAFWQDPSLTKDLRVRPPYALIHFDSGAEGTDYAKTRISTLVNGKVETASQGTERREAKSEPAGRRYTIVQKEIERKEPAPSVILFVHRNAVSPSR